MYKIEFFDSFLIATSEHPLIAMHSNEILSEKDLPLKYVGLSPCFRKEIGSHKIDERGLFRVHQFNKVEQIIYCKPEESEKFHKELLKNAEEFLQKLGIPYRVVVVCSGDLGITSAKTFDVEGFSPREQKFIELMSCSNCTSYQAVRSNIKYRKKNGEKEFVHTLNSTMVATARALRIIIETFQKPDGKIVVPKALRPFMNGLKEI
jgi:seryl-tRNA synthetase